MMPFVTRPVARLAARLIGALAMLMASSSVLRAQDFLDTQECRLDLRIDSNVDWKGLYGRGYEVFDGGESFEIVSLSIRHEGAACDYFLTGIVEDTGGTQTLQGPAGQLGFDVLIQPSGPSVLSPDYFGDPLSRLRGRFPRGASSQQVTFYIAIPPQQFVPGGTYSGRTVFRLFEDHLGSPELADQDVLGIVVPVASALKVESREAGPGARDLTVDLGNLGQGADRTVNFTITSNAAVTAEVSSANRGELAHFANAPGIEYRLWMSGQQVDLSQPFARQRLAIPGSTGSALPLRVVVDAQPGAAAGAYSDTLTVTFVVDS